MNTDPGSLDWSAGLKTSRRDPRIYIGILTVGVAIWLFLSAPPKGDLRGVYIASSVALGLAGLPQAIAAWTEHAREAATRRQAEWAAWDETRRVCLIALSTFPMNAEAGVTAVNALTYHTHHLDPSEAQGLIVSIRSGGRPHVANRIQECVNELCRERGEPPMFVDDASDAKTR